MKMSNDDNFIYLTEQDFYDELTAVNETIQKALAVKYPDGINTTVLSVVLGNALCRIYVKSDKTKKELLEIISNVYDDHLESK